MIEDDPDNARRMPVAAFVVPFYIIQIEHLAGYSSLQLIMTTSRYGRDQVGVFNAAQSANVRSYVNRACKCLFHLVTG